MSSLAEAEQLLNSISIQIYIDMACVTLWAHEYILTFVSEISFIWNAPWTFPKALFLLSRYWTLVTLIVRFYHNFQPSISDKGCLVSERFITWSLNICSCLAEAMLTIRTWAVWGRGSNVSIFLSIFIFISVVASLALMGIWDSILELTSVPAEVVPSRCRPITRSSLYFANYILMVIYEGVLLIMMSIKGYKALKDHPMDSTFFHAVYMDGVMYYISLFALSLINIIINIYAPPGYGNLLAILQQVIHSILACRMILQLRQCGKRTVCGDDFKSFLSGVTSRVNTLAFKPAGTTGNDTAD